MKHYKDLEIWFITGSQHLYGNEALKEVEKNSKKVANTLDKSPQAPAKIIWKKLLTTPDEITNLIHEANNNDKCIGIIAWMHTFSPAKMWINGLKILKKPLLDLQTQNNESIPFATIDMDFMNLNQTAHGGREFGYICTRLGVKRKVIIGHYEDKDLHNEIEVWIRASAAFRESKHLKVARFGDNMREVAVTEGDKVEAEIAFGFSVNGYGMGDLVAFINKVKEKDAQKLVEQYYEEYTIKDTFKKNKKFITNLLNEAKTELGLRAFLKDKGCKAFTTTFEDLHGLNQLPGLAVQRLMADGYGFGAEGDWKTAALLRLSKVMEKGLTGGTSFMEDYTYHFDKKDEKVLGSHMLEICPSIANKKPSLEMHPLGIGGKDDPIRLVFESSEGKGLNIAMMDMGNRFRWLYNEVEVVKPVPMPKLPVARVLWKTLPNMQTGIKAWIYGGGAHHTVFSKSLSLAHFQDLSEMFGNELVVIDKNTELQAFKEKLQFNEVYHNLKSKIC
ncbi:MAG: L-arabinose isomerase [Cytophagales bacterium]|nr:MAG: L-arabinose isomerase [Cytophagales bacterium]